MTTAAVEVVTAIAADDVRYEATGQPMIIGVLSPSIGFERFPAKLKIWFIPIVDVKKTGDITLNFRVVTSEGKELKSVQGKLDAIDVAGGILTPIGPISMTLDQPTELILERVVDDGAPQVLQTWEVLQHQEESGNPPLEVEAQRRRPPSAGPKRAASKTK